MTVPAVLSFLDLSQYERGICVVNNLTTREMVSSKLGEGYYRAYLLDIWENGIFKGQTLDIVNPWYISQDAAGEHLISLLPIGSNWTCFFDKTTLLLVDDDYNWAQGIITTWVIAGVAMTVMWVLIVGHFYRDHLLTCYSSLQMRLRSDLPETYGVLREEA